jgi:outer membrane lipoprotein-sorting protein
MKPGKRRLCAAALTLAFALSACGEKASPEAAPTAAPTASVALTASASATPSATPSAAPTAEASAAPTAEPVVGASASATASAKPSAAASVKATSTPKPTAQAKASSAPADPSAAPSGTPSAAPSASAAVEVGPAAEGSADAVAQKADDVFAPKKLFSSKFKQKLESKVTGQKKESSGTLYIERPSKVSFHYDPPNQNRMVSDGTTFKAYIAEDKQMFTSKVDTSAYAGGLAFLMGGLRKTLTFTFNSKADYKDGWVLLGKPRTPNANYELVMFYINKDKLEKGAADCIERIVIVDAQGNKNRFDFTDASFPASIDSKEWDFTPPAGTDIKKN